MEFKIANSEKKRAEWQLPGPTEADAEMLFKKVQNFSSMR